MRSYIWKPKRLRNSLIKKVFQISKTEREIERLIQIQPVGTLRDSSTVYTRRISGFPNQSVRLRHVFHLTSFITPSLAFCLLLLRNGFPNTSIREKKFRDVYFVLTAKELNQKGISFWREDGSDPADQVVMEIIAAGYRRFLAKPNRKTISYTEILFWKNLLKELKNIRSEPADNIVKAIGGNSFSSVLQVLIYVNYNDKEFVQHNPVYYLALDQDYHATRGLAGIKDGQNSPQSSVKKSPMFQMPLKPAEEAACCKKHPPLIEQLNAVWLQEELYYQERRMNIVRLFQEQILHSRKKKQW